MTDITLPTRTAGELTLPDGKVCWIQTLNAVHREDADKRARRFAQNECRTFLKGGVDYDSMLAEINALSPEQQSVFIAGDSFWPIREEAQALYPDPQEPEQGEASAQEFTQAHLAWEEECRGCAEKRQQHEEERFEQAKEAAMRLSAKVRRERCQNVFFTREFIACYSRRLKFETLLRAVRTEEDHLKRYFGSIEAVEDADDVVLSALWEFYSVDLDVPKGSPPTLPAQS